jgi:SAM-dependent methyltransferase
MSLLESAPYPPLDLANRVGSLEAAQDPYAYYDELGLRARRSIMAALPKGFSFEGKRVLDFGCGAGRTLRHFLHEAEVAEVWGCDIDAESVAWLEQNLSPPLHVFHNAPEPPLELPDGSCDLIWAVSVFTHLVETWSSWLLELRRVLRPGGLLVATYMGEGMSELIAGEPWQEQRIGMNVLRYGQSWDLGGPMVLHSPWWIREHWGRAFEVLAITASGFAADPPAGQGTAVLRKSDAPAPTRDGLERVDPGNAAEICALRHNIAQQHEEIRSLRAGDGHARAELERERDRAAELERQVRMLESSRSWRLTRPLRLAGRLSRSALRRLGERPLDDRFI